jgi:hypothetical protein
MKTLLLIAFIVPIFSYAQEGKDLAQPAEECRRRLVCDQLSDSQCFGRPVNSICMVDPQKGQAGFCHQRSEIYDQERVICRCY